MFHLQILEMYTMYHSPGPKHVPYAYIQFYIVHCTLYTYTQSIVSSILNSVFYFVIPNWMLSFEMVMYDYTVHTCIL